LREHLNRQRRLYGDIHEPILIRTCHADQFIRFVEW
jgi:hypothetical protein